MDQIIQQLVEYLRGTWRRRWIGLGVAWLVAIVGAVVLFKTPNKYEASARVYVDTQSMLKPLMSGLAFQPDIDQKVSIISRTLISRPNVEKLIRMTDLDLTTHSPGERENLIDGLARQLRLSAARDNIYVISYNHPVPDQAQRVVQALLSIFVESSLGDKRKGTDSARRFIEEQIRAYEKRLEEAENRLKDFRLKHLGLVGPDYFTKLGSLEDEIAQVGLELRVREEARDSLKRELTGEDPVFLPDGGPSAAGPMSELDARIDALKRNIDEMLRRYTDQHPDVVGTRRVIEQLEDERRREREARKGTDKSRPGITASTNPVFQQIRIQLAESEANVAALRTRLAELEARQIKLRSVAQSVPQIETEYKALNRDYEVQRRNYESLVSRRESAALSEEIDAAEGLADFRIIDPPRVSSKPVSPNRPLLLPLVLLFSLGAGVFASFMVSQIFPTFHDAQALRAGFDLPVLGSVTLLASPGSARQRFRRTLLFAGGLGALVALYGMAIGVVAWQAGA
jgi:polysaccharide chain length determinant protein (PEP-CTERM system associated)